MEEIAKYSGCFICGDKNEFGINAKFYFKDGKAYTETTASRHYEGYKNIYHGGITSALLDEVMIKALLARDIYAMTVEMTVKFHRIIETGQKILFEGEMTAHKGRIYITCGTARDESGAIVASATGKYLAVKESVKGKLQDSLER